MKLIYRIFQFANDRVIFCLIFLTNSIYLLRFVKECGIDYFCFSHVLNLFCDRNESLSIPRPCIRMCVVGFKNVDFHLCSINSSLAIVECRFFSPLFLFVSLLL